MAFLSLAPPVPVTGSGVFGDDGVTHKQTSFQPHCSQRLDCKVMVHLVPIHDLANCKRKGSVTDRRPGLNNVHIVHSSVALLCLSAHPL